MSAPLRVAGEAEVIVVGAGPAGASCAALLAERGHDVLLLDQSSFPRDKPCGDGLTRSAVSALKRAGLDDLLASSEQILGLRIFADNELFEQRKYNPTPRTPDRARCIRRNVLDDALLRVAVDRGARFQKARVLNQAGHPGSTGVEALIDSERCLLRSQFVVAADGATSRLRRTSVRPRQSDELSAYAVRAYFQCERPAAPFFNIYMPLEFHGSQLAGYGWVFPIEEHVVNIGVGYWRGSEIRSPSKIRDVLDSFVQRLQSHEESRLGDLQRTSKLAGSPLGVQFQRDDCEADGVVFVGDAARTTDPWSGEGIAYAIHGAELIADLVSSRARRRGKPLDAGTVLGRRFGRLRYDMASQLRLVERRFSQSSVLLTDRAQYPLLRTLQHAVLAPDETPTLLDTPVGALISREADMSEGLERVNQLLLAELETAFPFATELFHSEIRAGLGPLGAAILLAFGDSSHDDLLLGAASAIELVSAGAGPAREIVDPPTDDVARFNNSLCVLMTDFALSRGARQAARTDARFARELIVVMKRICQAQFTESQQLFDPHRTAEDYIRAAEARMAGPLALAARFAASMSELDPDHIARLHRFGQKLGIAAQISEDIGELITGIPAKGRYPGADLCLGAYSLPILYAAEQDSSLRELLHGKVTQGDLSAILTSVFETGAMTRALQLVTRSIRDASCLLDGLDGQRVGRLNALAMLTLDSTRTLIDAWPITEPDNDDDIRANPSARTNNEADDGIDNFEQPRVRPELLLLEYPADERRP